MEEPNNDEIKTVNQDINLDNDTQNSKFFENE